MPTSFPSLALLVGLGFVVAGRAQAQTTPPAAPLGQAAGERPAAKADGACAQPFGLRTGQQLEYQLLDAKGQPAGLLRLRVVSVATDSTGKKKKHAVTTVKLKSGTYGPKQEVLQQQDLTYTCRRDTVYTDGLAEINYDGLKSFRDRLLAPTGQALAWPAQPTAGTALPAGGAEVRVSSPSVAIASVNTTLKARRVLAGPVAVTVPAGTFSCYPVESQRELATAARADLVLKSTSRQVDYYAPAYGIIKTEYYDKNGKLLRSRVLAKK